MCVCCLIQIHFRLEYDYSAELDGKDGGTKSMPKLMFVQRKNECERNKIAQADRQKDGNNCKEAWKKTD